MPTKKNEFAELLTSVKNQKVLGHTDSKALLHWFLFNVFRLDALDARDTLCDGDNDKGIDGVWVDEDSEEIFLFQSKYTDQKRNLGDTDLKGWSGTRSNPGDRWRMVT